MAEKSKVLLIGPRYNRKEPSSTGGIVVLFENWVEHCEATKQPMVIVDTNKANYANVLVAYMSILWQVVRALPSCSVAFLHGTFKDYLYIAPWVLCWSKLGGKRVVLRKFAGSFEQDYNEVNCLKQRVLRYCLRKSDILLWETKALVEFGKRWNARSYWFPNVRSRKVVRPAAAPYAKRFVFISQVRKEKGIDILLETFKRLPEDYRLDIYGPLMGYDERMLMGKNYTYRGVLSAGEVCAALMEHDVLVLPTYWKSEGYPGIIIEAYSVGVPVISTKVGGIPEIVQDGYNGYLVAPDNAAALADALTRFTETDYNRMAANAWDSFSQFDAEVVNARVDKWVYNNGKV